MDKYYWICYEHTTKFGTVKQDDVFKEHPFKAIERLKKTSNGCFVILNFKEITKEEYDMYDLELEDM